MLAALGDSAGKAAGEETFSAEMTQGNQQYRVLERLAAGGMAEVFLAERVGLEGFKKRVAIKRVLPHLSQKTRFIAMFLDEARVSAYLTHSNVAQVFDIGVGENAYFIVMEYVEGSDLKSVMEYMRKTGRSFPVEVAAHIAEKMCEGLSYAHEAKTPEGEPLCIVHRDVSPPNVLITKYGEVKIVDFGLAKATSQLEKSDPGIVKGKFGYLSPEAAQGIEVDARADVFATGIILWELLAQKRLFLGENDARTVMQVRAAAIPSLAPINKDVPPELERILHRALAKDPDKRYASARDMGRELTTFLYKYGKPVSAHDVADLVRGTVASRKPSTKAKATTVGKLIEEALLEFKSLEEDDGMGEGGTTSERLMRGRVSHFEDIAKWIEEIEANPASEARSTRPVFGRRRSFEPLSSRNPMSTRTPLPATAASDDAATSTPAANEASAPSVAKEASQPIAIKEASQPIAIKEASQPIAIKDVVASEADDRPPNTRRSVPPAAHSQPGAAKDVSQPLVVKEASQPQAVNEASDSFAVRDATPPPPPADDAESESDSPPDVEESQPLATGDISRPVGAKKKKKRKSDKKDGERSSKIETGSKPIVAQKKETSSKIETASKPIAAEKKERSSKIETGSKPIGMSSKQSAAPVAPAATEGGSSSTWMFVAAALLLLAVGAYYGGLFGH